MKLKISYDEEKTVVYTDEQWDLLNNLRQRAQNVTESFRMQGFDSLTYGSIARGDVKPTSDIDIVLIPLIPSYRIELILEDAGLRILNKTLVQATPNDVIKGQYELDDEISITLLLTPFTFHPFEFYHFAGGLSPQQLKNNDRVPGIDKRLVLIQPTETGHRERALMSMQYEAAKILGITQQMIDQRIRVLTKRDKIGRTGVFLKEEVGNGESFEDVLRTLARKNYIIRRRLNFR